MTGGDKRLLPPVEQRGVQVPVYWVVVGVVVMFGSPLLSILAAVQIADRNAEHVVAEQRRTREAAEAAASQATEAAARRARRAVCELFALNLDVYDDTPPTTDTGRNLRQAYLNFYQMSGCQPTRK